MARSERLAGDVAQMAADGVDHTDRVFRWRFEVSGARTGALNAITESQELLVEVDAVLAKGAGVLIEPYYRGGRKK
jgi:hypothetical protein